MNNFKRVLLIGLLVSIGAMFYFSFFIDGFIISFSVIVLLLALYFYDDISPIFLVFSVAVISPTMRFLVDVAINSNVSETFINVYPDIFFYLSFGIIYYFMIKILGDSYHQKFYIVAFSSDFLSNLIELSVRTKIYLLNYEMVKGLFLVAVSRTLVIIFLIYLATKYKSMLQREEHEKRYKYLVMQSSRFKSEIYFLNKNKDQIERIMKLSHQIYQKTDIKSEFREMTLQLTKEIHEVKKDYIRVIQGLEALYFEDSNPEEMLLKDLFSILIENTEETMKQYGIIVNINYKCKVDVSIKKHYYVMSILRNLLNNSIEAFESKAGKIFIKTYEDEKNIIIHFEDDGSGIRSDEIDFIFNPGYSTKYDELTGDVSRGLGLALVRDMVENEFSGSIDVINAEGGTTFEIKLLKEVV